MSRQPFRFAWISCAALAVACTSTKNTGGPATPIQDTSAGDTTGTDGGGPDAGASDAGSSDAGKTDAGADTGKADASDTAPVQSYDDYMTGAIDEADLPAVTVAGIKDGKLAWVKAFGDASDGQKAKPDTVFYTSTLAHTVVGVAVMQLVEQGKLDLDANIDTYLPFPVHNPKFAKTAITLRMLLGMSASIADNLPGEFFQQGQPLPGDSTVTLAQFMADYFKPTGKFYAATDNFAKDPDTDAAIEPGTQEHYSDIGVALAAYVVEVVAKQPFDEYCKAKIFTPLQMGDTAWHLAAVDKKRLATGFGFDGQDYLPYEWYGYPYYPSTTLYTTAGDFARVLMMMIGKGTLDGAALLKPESVAMLTAPANPKIADSTTGLGWIASESGDPAQVVYGNEGGDVGFTAEAWFDPAAKTGVVILGNGEPAFSYYVDDPDNPDPDIEAAYGVLSDMIDASFQELQKP